jgi:hypothetical protein
LAVILVGIGKGLYSDWFAPSPLDVAYAECEPCELSKAEVDTLIDDVRRSTLTREQNRGLFIATYADKMDAEDCLPCADAVLDASDNR